MSVGNKTVTRADALTLYPELHALVTIKEAGWQFRPFTDDNGSLDGIVGFLNRENHIDALWIFDRNAVVGVRIIDDAPGDKGGTVWKHEGDLQEVIHNLLSLPEPSQQHAPTLILPSPSGLWTPR